MDEVPTQAPDFIVSLSIAPDSDLTANLSLALRAARVYAYCPSEAAVRAGNCVEGFRSPRNPSNPPHKVAGARIPGGDGLRPAGLCADQHSPAVEHARHQGEDAFPTRSGLRPSPCRRRGTACGG